MDAVVKLWMIFLCCYDHSRLVSANLPPVFSSDLSPPLVREDTAVGTAVLTLVATDPEGSRVRYGLQGSSKLRVDPNSGVVTIAEPLDREEKDRLRLVVSAEDHVEDGDNNVVRVPLELVVLDVNDNPPVFSRNTFNVEVLEDAAVGSTVLAGILLSDVDQVGEVLKLRCHDSAKNGAPCEEFDVVPEQMTSRQFRGSLILKKPLSYSAKSRYQLELVASDGANMVSVPLNVMVKDVQNSPPKFRGSTTGIVSESAPIGTLIITLHAEDADEGDPRRVMYEIVANPFDFFILDPESGELRTAKPLDRETVDNPAGIVTLSIKAYETERGSRVREPNSETSISISVTIQDVNDEPPTFNRREYRVSIPENLSPGTPVPDLDMIVRDTDVGSNSVFSIGLTDSSGRFVIEPTAATGSTSLSLRVSRGGLDYENPNERKFILLVVAEESLTNPKLSSTATVIVSVTDTNDNPPNFAQEAYTALISETASPGTVVTTITATDRDTGIFGSEGIRYSLFGNGAEMFRVDPSSGVITVSPCDTPGRGNCLDYEARPTYFLSLEAVDAEGEGQTSVVPVRISLRDVNDNPPRFIRSVYRAVIQEQAQDFDPPLVVKASDPDITSRITYSLVGGDANGLFTIDSTNGRIRVMSKTGLDISNIQSNELILTVEANDGVGSHTAKVRVSVQDINNNKPVFSESSYGASVQENSEIGTLVEQVSAADADTGANSEIEYRIMKGAFDDFRIDETLGKVFVSRKLHFDMRARYSIQIIASDKGVPRLMSTTVLNVTVIDNNDKNPYFIPTTQRVKVNEDVNVGSVVHVLKATDLDVLSETGLHFNISRVFSAVDKEGLNLKEEQRKGLSGLFTVSPMGEVILNGQLNRNITTEITLAVSVTDITADIPQIGHGFLVITVVDVNDNSPFFSHPWSPQQPIITATITEELPVGSVVTTITAEDIDSNIGGYMFATPSDVLQIDEATGVVTVRGRLDYELEEAVNATVIVYDTGVPQLTATATLIVKLTNINDEEPVFEKPIYDGQVEENAPGGTHILTVHAIDRDKDHLGTVSYSLAGDHKQYFAIDSSGRLTVAEGARLDRESLSEMRLRAVATDSGPEDTRRQSSVPIHVKVLDINDHSPRFTQKLFTAAIVENLPLRPPVPVLQVTAVDEDEGLNSALYYTISGGTGRDYFRLDPTTGILYPAHRLMAPEKQITHDLEISVRDMNGTGSSLDSTRAEITVLPQNENKPVFIIPARPDFKVPIPENSEPVLEVLTLSASDKDGGSNGVIRYHLKVNDENVQETAEFRLNPETGVLTTKKVLDREEIPKYELVLVAKDQGSPISYETLRVITVVVEDIDDNVPSFPEDKSQRRYSFRIKENLPKDTLVGQVQAHDADSGDNSKIFYYILSGNVNSNFYIDKSNGNLFTSVSLDREWRKTYSMLIKASNDPNLIINNYRTTLEMNIDTSIAYVHVNIDDENDSPPKFSSDTYYAGVPYNAEVEKLVRVVNAIDDDAGVNGSVIYSIRSSTFYRPGESKPVGSIVPSPFNITKEGKILTAALMSPYKRHRFLLQIQAKEVAPPHRMDLCQVNIWVWERDELIKVVMEETPQKVVQQQEVISAKLSEVLDGSVVIDEIRYFTHENNSVSRDWTEMLMHVVNKTSHVVPIKEVLKRVDRNYPLLLEAEATSQIRNIYPALLIEDKEEVDARMAGLIALVIALIVGLVSFVAVCCCLRFWVMTPAKSREHLIHRSLDEDLGLNTTENPLWLEQKLKTYEEQELSMQVMSEFDPTAVISPQGMLNGAPNVHSLDGQSNTYATIQKSHGGTVRSLQLRSLQQSNSGLHLGEDPGESNDYATLDHLHRPSGGTSASRNGPKVPGVETPLSAVFTHDGETPEIKELVTSFTGSTFQPPDPSSMANRPLPEEPDERRRGSRSYLEYGDRNSSDSEVPKNLTVNAHGEPCLVAELI